MLTLGSLFAGIGGIDLGFERAGFECKWQVEIDDYANKVLAKHWPNVARFRDIRECGVHNLEYVDCIAGGFPCQDISYAGKGAGLAGERSGLFYEAMRIVRELGPRYVVLENVTALLTRGIDQVLGTLASIGYDAEWHCIPAAAVGAPHIRDRAFVFAYARCKRMEGCGKKSFFRIKTLQGSKNSRGTEDWRRRSAVFTPKLCRSFNELPTQVDRLRCLGNAVVPQVAEVVANMVLDIHYCEP